MSLREGEGEGGVAWRLHRMASLHWRGWDGEWVVFDLGSGQTHQMDTLSAATLMALDAQAVGLPALVSRLADALQVAADQIPATTVGTILQRLQAAELIETALP